MAQYVKVAGLPTLLVEESAAGLVTIRDGRTTLIGCAVSPLEAGEELVLYQPLGDDVRLGTITEADA